MNKVEQIRAEIERLKSETINRLKEDTEKDSPQYNSWCGQAYAYTKLLSFIDSMPKQTEEIPQKFPLISPKDSNSSNKGKDCKEIDSEDLDNASWEYSDRDGISYGQRYAMQIDFKAGANWQKNQNR